MDSWFLVEAGLLEEPQYLHLKATTFGMEFANTLPLTDKNVYMEEINSKENIVAETKRIHLKMICLRD